VYPAGSPLAGQPGAIGAQGATVITPADAANAKRMVGAAYIDLALDLTDRLLITGAGRFETYDDSSGNVWSGKVSGLWKATDWLNFRGLSRMASGRLRSRSKPTRRPPPRSRSSTARTS
jgi:iron complex outermembrane receptor protein